MARRVTFSHHVEVKFIPYEDRRPSYVPLDAYRFQRRSRAVGTVLQKVLNQEHRQRVYEQRFQEITPKKCF